jgi:hypothetical protein
MWSLLIPSPAFPAKDIFNHRLHLTHSLNKQTPCQTRCLSD